jgi:transcriptional regulator with XRE-family HTH domain
VDVCLVIKRRVEELGLEQKDLATAAEVTESYISQLLARKKLPPAPDRVGRPCRSKQTTTSSPCLLERNGETKQARFAVRISLASYYSFDPV